MNLEAKQELIEAANKLAYDYIKHSSAFQSLSGEEWDVLAGQIAQQVLGLMDRIVDEAAGQFNRARGNTQG